MYDGKQDETANTDEAIHTNKHSSPLNNLKLTPHKPTNQNIGLKCLNWITGQQPPVKQARPLLDSHMIPHQTPPPAYPVQWTRLLSSP